MVFICNNMIYFSNKVHMYLPQIMGKKSRMNGPDSFITSDILYGSLHQLALAHYLDERHFSTVTAQEGKKHHLDPSQVNQVGLPFILDLFIFGIHILMLMYN